MPPCLRPKNIRRLEFLHIYSTRCPRARSQGWQYLVLRMSAQPAYLRTVQGRVLT